MALLNRTGWFAAAIVPLLCLLGCGEGGDLTSAASALVEVQRNANLTRTTLSGTWDGHMSTSDGVARQTFILVFEESDNFSIDGSLLIGGNIHLGGRVSQDTTVLTNGVFSENQIRFNLAELSSGELILIGGDPVLFNGLLTENSFMSGELKAGSQIIGTWEAVLSEETAQ
ncbi:MAG TPA: hypothetical protein VM123_20890 [archaeon]|nr:hypothetical protein [archaeon]